MQKSVLRRGMEAGLWVLALGFMGCGGEVAPAMMDSGVACAADERVLDSACAPCPAGTSNEAGDDAGGTDTVCDAVSCPANSTGMDVATGCSCDAGYAGDLSPSTAAPYYAGSCANVNECDAASTCGADRGAGSCTDTEGGYTCTCSAGYAPSGMGLSASCEAVACPDGSTGTDLPSGCSCEIDGSVEATDREPYYEGECATAPELSAKGNHTCALLSTGGVRCWGYNRDGQLGDGSWTSSATPVAVSLAEGVTVTVVSAGRDHTCALLSTGGVQCWGSDQQGQLGDGTSAGSSTPVDVPFEAGVTATTVSAGYFRPCALLSTGGVQCWGRNSSGHSAPVAVSLGEGVTVTAVSAGGGHTCALLSTGGVQCWGFNNYGQLGDGTTADRSTPVAVSLGAGVTATAVSAGLDHTCALLSTGGVQCWGDNKYGQLGDGSSVALDEYSSTPVSVAFEEGVVATAVSTGYGHTCAVLSTGAVQCWGWNRVGQLGDGGRTDSSTPVSVVWSGPAE